MATASTDEDDGQSGFEDFATAAYTNGANSASAMFVIWYNLAVNYSQVINYENRLLIVISTHC